MTKSVSSLSDPVLSSVYSPADVPLPPEPETEPAAVQSLPPEHRIVAAHHFPNGRGWETIDLEDENGNQYSISAGRLWDDLSAERIRCYVRDDQGVSWLKAEYETVKRLAEHLGLEDVRGEALNLYGNARAETLKDLEPGEIARRSASAKRRLEGDKLEGFLEKHKAKKEKLLNKKNKLLQKGSPLEFETRASLDWLDWRLDRLEGKHDRVVFGIED